MNNLLFEQNISLRRFTSLLTELCIIYPKWRRTISQNSPITADADLPLTSCYWLCYIEYVVWCSLYGGKWLSATMQAHRMQIIAHEPEDTEKHARILVRPGMLFS